MKSPQQTSVLPQQTAWTPTYRHLHHGMDTTLILHRSENLRQGQNTLKYSKNYAKGPKGAVMKLSRSMAAVQLFGFQTFQWAVDALHARAE